MLVLVLVLSLYVRLSLVLILFPPGSYTRLPLSLVLKLLGSRKWLWVLLLWLLLLLSLCVDLPLMSLSGLWLLLWGTCACEFVIGSASPFPMFETFASSCAQQLFGLASVSLDRLGSAVVIGEGRGRGSRSL